MGGWGLELEPPHVRRRARTPLFRSGRLPQVLALLQRNVNANTHLMRRRYGTVAPGGYARCPDRDSVPPIHGEEPHAAVAVRKLDWFNKPDGGHPDSASCSNSSAGFVAGEGEPTNRSDMDNHAAGGVNDGGCGHSTRDGTAEAPANGESPFAWRDGELQSLRERRASHVGAKGLVIMASDIIYDTALTEAFFDALRGFMPPPRKDSQEGRGGADAVLYLALEKRFNFTLEDLSVTATGYRAFVRNVLEKGPGSASEPGGRLSSDPSPKSRAPVETQDFEGVRLPLDYTQCFMYHRSEAMELWEIRRRGGGDTTSA